MVIYVIFFYLEFLFTFSELPSVNLEQCKLRLAQWLKTCLTIPMLKMRAELSLGEKNVAHITPPELSLSCKTGPKSKNTDPNPGE